LHRCVERTLHTMVRDPTRPDGIVIEEVIAQHMESSLRLIVTKKCTQADRDVLDTRAEVPYEAAEIIGAQKGSATCASCHSSKNFSRTQG
jgi:hypothetical protein